MSGNHQDGSTNWHLNQWGSVEEYVVDSLLEKDPAMDVARASSSETTAPNIEVPPNQGALLKILAQLIGARRALEIGTLAGYSSLWLAQGVGEGGTVVTLEIEEQNAAVARKNFEANGVADRVSVMLGPASDSLETLLDDGEPFDLVFIDADKRSNPEYLAAAIKLTQPGALIVVDNVIRNGQVLEADTQDPDLRGTRQVIADVGASEKLEATALQLVGSKGWDGIIVARRI